MDKLNKENKKILLIVFGVIILVFAMFSPLLINAHKQDKLLRQACEERNLNNCFANKIHCFDNCNNLDLTYLKYDSTGFGSSECWCYNNDKQPKQIY